MYLLNTCKNNTIHALVQFWKKPLWWKRNNFCLIDVFSCVLIKVAHLHSDLRQVDLQGQLLSAVHVRVVGLLKGAFQFVQLEGGEGGSVPTVLFLLVLVVWQFAVSVRRVRAGGGFTRAAAAAHTCGERRRLEARSK